MEEGADDYMPPERARQLEVEEEEELRMQEGEGEGKEEEEEEDAIQASLQDNGTVKSVRAFYEQSLPVSSSNKAVIYRDLLGYQNWVF